MTKNFVLITGRLFETPELTTDAKKNYGLRTVTRKDGKTVELLTLDLALTNKWGDSLKVGKGSPVSVRCQIWGQNAVDLFTSALRGDLVAIYGYYNERTYYSKCTKQIETATEFIVPETDGATKIVKLSKYHLDVDATAKAVAEAIAN